MKKSKIAIKDEDNFEAPPSQVKCESIVKEENKNTNQDKIAEMFRDPTIDDEQEINDSDVELYLEAQDMAWSQNSIEDEKRTKSIQKGHIKHNTDPYGNLLDDDMSQP